VLLTKAKQEGKITHMCFVDLKKAYDNVSRKLLWQEMEKKGLGGKFLRIIKQMYKNQRRKVRIKSGWTEWINNERGISTRMCFFATLVWNLY
jgi:hypothetical protein